MKKAKKALVCVQGINSKDYILAEITGSKFPIDDYHRVVTIGTEDIFDKTIPGIIKILPFIGDFYDQYIADIRAFFKNKEARQTACRMVRKQIKALQKEGYEVHVIAHSLGTIITMCCGPQKGRLVEVHAFFCYNSPLGFGIFPGGIITRNFVRTFMRNFKAKRLEFIYSAKDTVSRDYKAPVSDILNEIAIEPKFMLNTWQDHKLSRNINERYNTAT